MKLNWTLTLLIIANGFVALLYFTICASQLKNYEKLTQADDSQITSGIVQKVRGKRGRNDRPTIFIKNEKFEDILLVPKSKYLSRGTYENIRPGTLITADIVANKEMRYAEHVTEGYQVYSARKIWVAGKLVMDVLSKESQSKIEKRWVNNLGVFALSAVLSLLILLCSSIFKYSKKSAIPDGH